MSESICPNSSGCPVYSGKITDKFKTTEDYKKEYCEAGTESYESCRRYQVRQVIDRCPQNVLPNTPQSVDDLLSSMDL